MAESATCPFHSSPQKPVNNEPVERTFQSLPQPAELPLLGSLVRRLWGTLEFFGDLRKLGTVVRFTIGNEKFLLVNEPDMIREIMVTKQQYFHKGKALQQAKKFLGNSVLVSEGQEHARQRKLMQPAFHRSRIEGYATMMANDAAKWVDAQKSGSEVDLSLEMNRLTLAIVGNTLFGSTVEEDAVTIAEALTVVLENFNRMLLPLYDVLWSRLPTPQNWRLQRAQARLDSTIAGIIAARRAEGKDRGDLLSMLLAAEDEESEQKHLSDHEIRDQALTLFLAGHETTANGLTWTWYLLAQHPEVLAKMKAEILSVLGADRLPGLDDVEKLPYTTAVFSEGLRLYPPIWAIGRRAIASVVIDGVEVPNRTIVVMSPYLMHRDERFWKDPLIFNPDRWIPEDESRPKFAYFPFAAGPRICMGESFAWTEAVIVLAVMARRWKLTPVTSEPVIPHPTATLRPKTGFPVKITEA